MALPPPDLDLSHLGIVWCANDDSRQKHSPFSIAPRLDYYLRTWLLIG